MFLVGLVLKAKFLDSMIVAAGIDLNFIYKTTLRLLVLLLPESHVHIEPHTHLTLHHGLLVWLTIWLLHWLLVSSHHTELIVWLLWLAKGTKLSLLPVKWLLLGQLLLAVCVYVQAVEIGGGCGWWGIHVLGGELGLLDGLMD